MNRTLSVTEWHQLAREGTSIPVKIPLMGLSMFPLIRYNRDMVTVMPVETAPQKGDIVLFEDGDRKLYVMHRVWELKDGMALTWGDNCDQADGWIPEKEILGKAVLIERGKRMIHPNPKKGIQWARFWHWAGKRYRVYRKYRDRLAAAVRKNT